MKVTVEIVISLLLAAIVYSSAADAQQSSPTSDKKAAVEIEKDLHQEDYKDWQKIESGAYSFYAPKDFNLTKKRGADAEYFIYKSKDVDFTIVEGPYAPDPSPTPTKGKNVKYKSLLIDKVPVRICSYEYESDDYKYVRAIRFQPPKWKGIWVAISLHSKDAKGQELAEKIFLSIKFNRDSKTGEKK